MKKTAILIIGIILCLVLAYFNTELVSAMPASPDEFLINQPDGSSFMARQWGDEWLNGFETVEGFTIIESNDGWWIYATTTDDQLGLQASQAADGHTMRVGLDSPEGLVPFIRPQSRKQPVGNVAQITRSFGNQPVLAILVSFSDRNPTYPASYYQNLLFGSGKSLRDYYNKASFGKFGIEPAKENWGTSNDGIIGWINLDYPHPNTQGNTDYRNQNIAKNALLFADQYVDFIKYDRNYDGIISSDELHILLIVSGYEAATSGGLSPAIWAHRGAFYGQVSAPVLDNVVVGDYYYDGGYTQVGEIFYDHPTTVGTVAHELGHDIGWPDLYDISSQSEGVGNWSVMGTGGWNSLPGEYFGETPSFPDGWSKSYQGWINPASGIDNNYGLVYLFPAATNESAWLAPFNVNGVDWRFRYYSGFGEYFLFEFRKLESYDAALPGQGILVWHIDESVESSNYANSNRDNPLVKLLQADGLDDLYWKRNRGDAGDPYNSGNNFNNYINDYTYPSTRYYDNRRSKLSIEIYDTTYPYYASMYVDLGGNSITYLPLIQNRKPLIKNGDFENGRNGDWADYSQTYGYVIYKTDPFDSNNWVADFGPAHNEFAYLGQANISRNGNIFLNLDMLVESTEVCSEAYYDEFYIRVNDVLMDRLMLCRDSVRWFPRTYYIGGFGNEITIEFFFYSDGSNYSRVMVDNISLSNSIREYAAYNSSKFQYRNALEKTLIE